MAGRQLVAGGLTGSAGRGHPVAAGGVLLQESLELGVRATGVEQTGTEISTTGGIAGRSMAGRSSRACSGMPRWSSPPLWPIWEEARETVAPPLKRSHPSAMMTLGATAPLARQKAASIAGAQPARAARATPTGPSDREEMFPCPDPSICSLTPSRR